MNEQYTRDLGFEYEMDLVRSGKCPFCKRVVDLKKLH